MKYLEPQPDLYFLSQWIDDWEAPTQWTDKTGTIVSHHHDENAGNKLVRKRYSRVHNMFWLTQPFPLTHWKLRGIRGYPYGYWHSLSVFQDGVLRSTISLGPTPLRMRAVGSTTSVATSTSQPERRWTDSTTGHPTPPCTAHVMKGREYLCQMELNILASNLFNERWMPNSQYQMRTGFQWIWINLDEHWAKSKEHPTQKTRTNCGMLLESSWLFGFHHVFKAGLEIGHFWKNSNSRKLKTQAKNLHKLKP